MRAASPLRWRPTARCQRRRGWTGFASAPRIRPRVVLTKGNELKLVYPQVGVDPARFEGLAFEHFFLQPMERPVARGQYGQGDCVLPAAPPVATGHPVAQDDRNSLGPVHTNFTRCVADQKCHAQGAKRSRVGPRQGFATPRMHFWPQPGGNVVKTAPLVVALLAQAASLGVVARLDWRGFNHVRTCEISMNRP